MNTIKHILVIDDDESIRDVIKMILDDEGYAVRELDNGHQAEVEDAISADPPDLILLDVMLGDSDGRDVCRELKTGKSTADIPIIMVSATHGRSAVQGEECPADDYLSKPFDINDLVRKVRFYAAA
jgi:DNA-binding response OmpR family regulator